VGAIIVLAAVPPVSKDALVHHLALPKLYLLNGGMYEIPFMNFSYYPMNLDLLYMGALYLGNDILPKYIHFAFGMLTALLIFSYLRKRLSIAFGLLGALFFLSIPIVLKLSIAAYVDLGLVFFSTAALMLLLRWLEAGFKPSMLILSGVCAGLAAGTKYNGLITLFLLTLFSCFLYARHSETNQRVSTRSLGSAILFLTVGLAFFSPWGIRNFIWTENPVFPLYDNWLHPERGSGLGWPGIFRYRQAMYGETIWETILIPIRVFFQGQDGSPRFFDGKLNFLLLVLPAFAFAGIRREPLDQQREKWIFLGFAVLYFLFAFFGRDMRVRYLAPILPCLVILSIFGLKQILDFSQQTGPTRVRQASYGSVFAVAILYLGLNASYALGQFHYVRPLDYIRGNLSRQEYVTMFRLEYPAMHYVNVHLPADAKVLFFFVGKRGYYCDRSYVLDMTRNQSKFKEIASISDSPHTMYRTLREMGITHFLIRYDIFDKWIQSGFSYEEKNRTKLFFKKYTKLVFYKLGYGICEIKI
jgi:hypothetical protein